jgi:hypothetical protein
MSNYFKNFPTVQHDLTNVGQKVALTNILRRFKVRTSVKDKLDTYYTYHLQAGDRPDIIAEKYYGDPNLAWVILHFNDIIDPVFGWPLFGVDFDNYIKGKYANINTAKATVHEYRQVLNVAEMRYDGVKIPERYIVVDQTTYGTLGSNEKYSVSKYDYEEELNEKRREIRILDKAYISKIKQEVKSILK